MSKGLIRRWNSVVRDIDIVYHLGDIGFFKGDTAVDEMYKIISQLNGTKIALRGNHDKGYQTILKYGFDAVVHNFTMEIAGEMVTVSHYPLLDVFREDVSGMRGYRGVATDNWHGETKHRERAVRDFGQFHLHGHTHCGPANGKPVRTDRQFDVGCPGNNYAPVSLSTIESWIAKEKYK